MSRHGTVDPAAVAARTASVAGRRQLRGRPGAWHRGPAATRDRRRGGRVVVARRVAASSGRCARRRRVVRRVMPRRRRRRRRTQRRRVAAAAAVCRGGRVAGRRPRPVGRRRPGRGRPGGGGGGLEIVCGHVASPAAVNQLGVVEAVDVRLTEHHQTITGPHRQLRLQQTHTTLTTAHSNLQKGRIASDSSLVLDYSARYKCLY